jgi:hypothetical protein
MGIEAGPVIVSPLAVTYVILYDTHVVLGWELGIVILCNVGALLGGSTINPLWCI